MAIAANHTNYAKNITDALVADVVANVADVTVENRARFPVEGEDDFAFIGVYGRAILLKLESDEPARQYSDTWESNYRYTARIYVQDTEETQHNLSDLVEDFKHNLFVNQSNQNDWVHANYTSVVYNEVESETAIKTADLEFFLLMRAT